MTLTFVEWLSVPSATGYDLMRGLSSLLSSSRGNYTNATQQCLANDQPGTAYVESDTPPPGRATGTSCAHELRRPRDVRRARDGLVAPRDAEINASPNACP